MPIYSMREITGSLIPIYLDPAIIDLTRLCKNYGTFTKSFENYEEMVKWVKKAHKLNPGMKI